MIEHVLRRGTLIRVLDQAHFYELDGLGAHCVLQANKVWFIMTYTLSKLSFVGLVIIFGTKGVSSSTENVIDDTADGPDIDLLIVSCLLI